MEMSQGGILVALAVVLLQVTVSTVWYFLTFRKTYVRLVNAPRPAFDRTSELPAQPLLSSLGTLAACILLTALVNWLVLRLEVTTWQEGLTMALVLLLAEACLNARHYFFEGRPLSLFLLHAGYHASMLSMTCCLLAVFGQPPAAVAGRAAGVGGLPAALEL